MFLPLPVISSCHLMRHSINWKLKGCQSLKVMVYASSLSSAVLLYVENAQALLWCTNMPYCQIFTLCKALLKPYSCQPRLHPYLCWMILWRIDLSNVFKYHPSTSSDRCGRNRVQAYVVILSTILFTNSSELTPRMNCMSASVDMPSQFLVWRNTPALVEFTSLEHQLHSLNDWSNQVSIKPWLISLPAFAFVFW